MPTTTRAMAKRSCRRPLSSISVEPTDESSSNGRGVEDEEDEWIGRTDHPLLNDVVLTTLFAYVEGNDLKSCRLVNKKWHLRSLPFAGSRLQVTVSGKRGHVKQFVKLIQSNTLGFPKFEKFFLGPFHTRRGFGQKLLQRFGQTAKEFLLVSEDGAYYRDEIEDISEIFRTSPNLESFKTSRTIVPKAGSVIKLFSDSEDKRKRKLPFLTTLYFRGSWAADIMDICPTFYEELFQAAENLSTLTVMGLGGDSNFEILRAIEKVGTESTIENLKLGNVTSEHFDFLHRMALKPNGLKLKQFEFENWLGDSDWCELIKFFSDTLVALRMFCISAHDIFNTIPYMPNLKFFYFYMTETAHLKCDNFHNTFPALENVELWIWTSEQFNELMTGDERCPIKKSSIYCAFPMTVEILNRIERLFPNLRNFSCMVTPELDGVEVIKFIWTHMTQLKNLKVRGTLPASVHLDSLVTGIPIRQIRKMRGRKELYVSLKNQNIEDRRERILGEINKHGESVSIRNLTNLHFLDIQLTVEASGNKRQQRNYLTDFTGYFGFYALKSLRQLGVNDCGFSKSCVEVLVKDLSLEYWRFHHAKTNNQIIPSNWKYKDDSNAFPIQV